MTSIENDVIFQNGVLGSKEVLCRNDHGQN